MFKKFLQTVIIVGALSTGTAFAAEPSIDQVYQTAKAGRLEEAQKMMDQVLQAHPNSAKAHFVHAELDSKLNQFAQAEKELKTAEQLQPGLPFAKPEAVQELKGLIASWHSKHAAQIRQQPGPAAPLQAPQESGSSFTFLLWIIGGLLVLFFILQMFRNRQQAAYYPQSGQSQAGYSNYPANNPAPSDGGYYKNQGGAVAPGYYPQGTPAYYPQSAPAGNGVGSGIMSGLATGAAMGVGIVAGEALAHRFFDVDNHNASGHSNNYGGSDGGNNFSPIEDNSSWNNDMTNDMGGNDFGIADSNSWDSNTSVADNSSLDGGNSDSGDSWS